MRRIIFGLIAALAAAQAYAQEAVGCDKFKWPLERERALLMAPGITTVTSGAEIEAPVGKAVSIKLMPFADAKLPMPPERAPRAADANAGFIKLGALKQASNYHITVSAGGWIDVIQDNHLVKSRSFSGALGCEGVRKSVTFDLVAAPLTVQFSGVPADAIGMVMTPTER
jgi:hypothetical protein